MLVLIPQNSVIPIYLDKKCTQSYTFSETPIIETSIFWKNIALAGERNFHFCLECNHFCNRPKWTWHWILNGYKAQGNSPNKMQPAIPSISINKRRCNSSTVKMKIFKLFNKFYGNNKCPLILLEFLCNWFSVVFLSLIKIKDWAKNCDILSILQTTVKSCLKSSFSGVGVL